MFICQEVETQEVETNVRPRTTGLACMVCGCTDERACPGGCWWVSQNPPLCSACGEISDAIEEMRSEQHSSPAAGGFFGHQRCPASAVPASHTLLWIDGATGYCTRCREGFVT